MASNIVFIGWGSARVGRETLARDLFGEFTGYLGQQQQQGTIASFEPVLLDPHGGDLNGFILIRGESDSLDKMVSNEEFLTYLTRAGLYLESLGVTRGAGGDLVMSRMQTWSSLIPS